MTNRDRRKYTQKLSFSPLFDTKTVAHYDRDLKINSTHPIHALTHLSRCNRQMRSLETRNFFATDFFSWSTLWAESTVTAKLPPVVVLMFRFIGLSCGDRAGCADAWSSVAAAFVGDVAVVLEALLLSLLLLLLLLLPGADDDEFSISSSPATKSAGEIFI